MLATLWAAAQLGSLVGHRVVGVRGEGKGTQPTRGGAVVAMRTQGCDDDVMCVRVSCACVCGVLGVSMGGSGAGQGRLSTAEAATQKVP